MTRVVSRGLAPSTTPVVQVMTPNPVVVDAQSTVEQCLRIMTQAKCRHLPVVKGGKLIGVVSIRDLLQSDISEKSDEIEMMRAFIHYVPPSTPAGPEP
jgi:signal-transduction protein with cAMP-binding, CBS, and nucleotidyltransferase domain